MLDQNTDRMWYVIGAVIVGAALIFLMNNAFPTLFANVGTTFEDKVGQTTEMTDGIRPVTKPGANLIGSDDLELYRSELIAYDEKTDTWDLLVYESLNWWDNGLRMIPGHVVVPFGESFTLSYEIFVPKEYAGLYSAIDINNSPMGNVVPWSASLNDNDVVDKRLYNGKLTSVAGSFRQNTYVTAGEWMKVWYTYENTSSMNTQKVALSDFSIIGIHNTTGGSIPIKIRHVKGELSNHPTDYVDKETVAKGGE